MDTLKKKKIKENITLNKETTTKKDLQVQNGIQKSQQDKIF